MFSNNNQMQNSLSQLVVKLDQEKKTQVVLDDEQIDRKDIQDAKGVKAFQSKFIQYLNQLNSSIQTCKRKTMKKYIKYEQKRKSSNGSDIGSQNSSMNNENCSKDSKKSYRNQKRRLLRQYTIVSGKKINGRVEGQAILNFGDGSVFKGLVENGQIKQGIINFPDGTEYEGTFKNHLFHGDGKIKLHNGIKFKSSFKFGTMAKNGQIEYDNGEIYKGEIYKFKKHGKGQLILTNGNRYVGDFFNGDIKGYGVYYVNQFPTAEGMWNNGQFLGKQNFSSSLVSSQSRSRS